MGESKALSSLYTLKEAAEFLKCHPNTLRLWDKKGILPAVRIGQRRSRRYRKEDLLTLLTTKPLMSDVISGRKYPHTTDFQAIHHVCVILDVQLRIQYVSSAAAKILKIQSKKLIGKPLDHLLTDSLKKLVLPKIIESQTLQKEVKSEVQSEDIWYRLNIYPVPESVTLFLRDVTLIKEKEERLIYYAALSQNISDAVISTDVDQVIVSWNKGAELLYGWTEREAIGKKAVILLQTVYPTSTPRDWEKKLETVGFWKGDVIQTTKDGSTRLVFATISTVRDQNGVIIGSVAVNRDISEEKQIEQTLKFKADATKILSSSLDYTTTLQSVANLAVDRLADWCSVDLFSAENVLEQVAIAHKDPKKLEWAKLLREKAGPPDMNVPSGLSKVLRTATSEFYPSISDELLVKAAKNPEELVILRKMGFTSAIIAPIVHNGRVTGAITFVSAESKRHFTQVDLQMAEQIASRASLAIENARLYEEVHDERERLVTLLGNVPGVVWEAYRVPDPKKKRTNFVSSHVKAMIGYTQEEWLATPNFWLTIVHPEDRKRAETEAAVIFEKRTGGTSRFRWITKDGRDLWVEAQSFVIFDKKGNPIGMRGVSMDISERMELEKRKDEFISMASHELKTPITSLRVFSHVLEGMFHKKNEVAAVKHLKRMNEQINKLSLLVNDLLDVSKMQAGKLELRIHQINLVELVAEAVSNMATTSPSHTISYASKSKNIPVEVDKDRMYQVLINLISNAIKYSPEFTSVTVQIKADKKFVIVSVIDQGIGISKTHQSKIFQRFYRVHDKETHTFPGLGIGLYIAERIVNRHHGRLWVESALGKGSTFSFSLPRATGDALSV